ncbi:spore germination protein [Paenibacillus brasilensis]|uniref:Spore germination protein n=1 Tax=Paenibacillus brasilensis TaxID=128574 RepID=A0ABU0L6R5_9BACL|nr:spore germination protein [Paenibacillus brasilensis]
MEKPKKATRVIGLAIGIAAFFYIAAVVLCIGAFSVEGVMTRTWPFLDLARSFEVEYLVFERFESLLLSIWIMQIFATFSIAFYCASLGVSQILNRSYSAILFILLPAIYILSQIPKNLNELFSFGAVMKRVRLGLLGISALLICSTLSGCWSSSPVEDLNLETGIAMDVAQKSSQEEQLNQKGGYYPKKELIKGTFQFIVPEENKSSGSSPSQTKKFYNITETGDSVFEMLREISLRTNRPPIGFHLKTVIISSSLLRKVPLYELLDFFLRDNDIRPSVQLLISTDEAGDALQEKIPGQTPAFILKDIFVNRKRNSRMLRPVSLAKVIGPMKANRSFLLPNVITTESEVKIAGAGIIKGKAQTYGGFLNESEVEGLMWIKGELKGGLLKDIDHKTGKNMAYEIKSTKSRIKAIVQGDDISFRVRMTSEGRISENFNPNEALGNNRLLGRLESIFQGKANSLAEQTVAKMHKLRVDVGGFGEALRIQHPKVWRKVKKDWDTTFSTIPVQFSTDIHIEDYGASNTTADWHTTKAASSGG